MSWMQSGITVPGSLLFSGTKVRGLLVRAILLYTKPAVLLDEMKYLQRGDIANQLYWNQ